MDEKTRALVLKYTRVYTNFSKKLEEYKGKIENCGDSNFSVAFAVKRVFEDIIFVNYIIDKLIWSVKIDLNKDIDYDTIVKYLLDELKGSIKSLISCPWNHNSTSAVSNVEKMVEANALAEWIKINAEILETEGIRSVELSTMFL